MKTRDFFKSANTVGLSPKRMAGVVGLGFAMAVCEAAGVVMMLPALEFIQSKGELSASVLQSFRWRMLDNVFAWGNATPTLGGLLLIAFIVILLRQAMQYAHRVYTSVTRNQLTALLRHKLFCEILAADLGVIEQEATGRLINDFTTEADTAVTSLMFWLQIFVISGICLVYLCVLLLLSPAMTALSLVLMAITAFTVRSMINRTNAIGVATTEANQGVGIFLVERFRALRLMRLSGTEEAERSLAKSLLNEQTVQRISGDKIVAKLTSAIEPVFIGFAFFCLWFGSIYLKLGLESLGLFLVIVLRLGPIGKDLLSARQIVLQTKPSLDCIESRLQNLGRARENDVGGAPLIKLSTGLRFENVCFSYNGSHAALDGVTLEIPARRATAIIGPSGGGKSTLIDLLPSLRRPQSGTIFLDDIPLDHYNLKSLRDRIAFVPQTAQIFNVTAAEHIRYGRPDASPTEIEDAARRANAYDFISRLPDGFDTRLGEGGSKLSGGQRQRLDLARALARRTPILILDEPTSALDAESEKAFRDALDAIIQARETTVIIIAHRLSMIAHIDQIIILESGRISASGNHTTLLGHGGWYAAAWNAQSDSPPLAINSH